MWADCESRGPMIRNSLAGRIQDLERAASRSRRAYKQPFMNEPMQWYANALDEAAAVLSRHLAALARHEGEGNGVS